MAIITCDAADLDGTNDNMVINGDLTGITDGKAGTFSGWARFDGGDGAARVILALRAAQTTPVGLQVSKNPSNKIVVLCQNSAASSILNLITTPTYVAGAAWYNILASWDLAASVAHLYINDAAPALDTNTITNDTIEYTRSFVGVGGTSDGAQRFNGCLAEIFFHNTYIDLSVTANRRKFITAGGFPVNLGSDGSTPLGVQPLLYLHLNDGQDANDFDLNKGSGGNFTIVGSLDTASTSPSDGAVEDPSSTASASSGASSLRRKRETWSLRVDGEVLIFASLDAVLAFIQTYQPKAEVRAEVKAERDAKRILRMGRAKANPTPPQIQVKATGEAQQYVDEVQAKIDRLYWKALADALAREAEELEDMKFIAEIL